MSEPTGLFSRLASMFGRKDRLSDRLGPHADDQHTAQMIDGRPTLFRPWAKRDQALQSLSEGFVTLTQLMNGIKDNLDQQNARQEDLVRYLAALPQLMEQLPESNRVHGEALKAIYQQLATQNQAQATLGQVLDKICTTGQQQTSRIDALGDQLDGIRQTDAAINDNLSSVSTAMHSLSQGSNTSTAVLTQLRDSLATRDLLVQQVIEKQNQRFNFIFWLSVVLSITTLVSLALVTYIAMK